ncbi:GntR family transcriptional regulator [Jannaschia seohaensis]|uniref:DNA-binding GntR family transcriptional regulator n=1 Tax=Jannaschia seohaensis TaxID=475081 RepID=A0A2Y9A3V6_9RHOB|nr:GntR family transcriptional regulator [Jannaschia seohaensis]PWJ21870.1 DNA-binding GntR family transcriptional regulator [Jannaschia seohaensis]SSA38148.1 DNA-binding transcriptional regulator, GntR family [Jannaschia seohaensis]
MSVARNRIDSSPARGAPSTLSETAYLTLSRMIQERELPVGRPVVETQLAEMLGVSRTPLRQALQRLEAEGQLRKSETRSYVVRRVELREYLQSLKAREILEAEAAEMAIGRIAPEALESARAHLHAVQRRQPYDMLAHWASDDEVHDLYIESCGNAVIRDLLKSLRVTTKLFEIERLSERLEPDSSQHEAILDALESGDGAAVRAAVIAHLRSLAEFAVRVL